MSTENWTEIKEWTKSLLKYRLYGNRRIYIDAIYLNIKDRITLKFYSCTEGSRFKYTTKFSFEGKWCLYTKDAIKWLTANQKSSKFLTPVLYSSLSLWIRASRFLHLRHLEGGTSPRLTVSTDISEFACSSLRHIMNFHIEGCLTTTDWFHALWKLEEKNEKTIISNFILMKTVDVTSILAA